MNTSEDGYRLIQLFEGCKLTAYRPVPGGNWTIGWGNEGKLYDGRPIVEGMTISQQEADDDFAFTMYNEVDPLVRSYFNTQGQAEFDACASWVYNIKWDKLRRGEYTLPKLVNLADRSPNTIDDIIEMWLKYHKTPGAYDGLYRRRIIELCKFMSLPWNTPAILGTVRTIKAGEDPEPVFQMAEAIYDQMNADNQTAALNNAELERLGGTPEQPVPKGTPSVKPKAVEVKKVDKPTIDPNQEPTLIEKSKTGKAVNRAERGKETTIIGAVTGTGLTAAAANAEKVGNVIEKFKPETFMIMAGLFGLFMVGMGVLMWWSGRSEAHWRRQIEQDPKV